ncbi:MAG: MBL fold metallo-hydrolase [Clostridia bacterium]|nr:MBL fold metallo-hydrolase [Clostridia bacterium]
MRVKTVGTGSISVKQRSACSLIDDKILVDCGNGIVKTLLEQNIDVNKIYTLLITHLHGDHFADIPFLIMQRNFCPAENELNIFCPVGTEEIVGKIFSLIYSDTTDWTVSRDRAKIKFTEFDSLENREVTDGYFVNSYVVDHGNFKPAYGFIISNGDKKIGVSGDSTYCENIEKIVSNSDISILDMSFIESGPKHMGVNDIKRLSEKYNKKMIGTHMSYDSRKFVIDNKFDRIIVPNDGDVFEV